MLESLEDLINPDVIINIATLEKKLTIKEKALDSKIKKIHINKLPENSFAFTLDFQPSNRRNKIFQQLSAYLNIANDKGINKSCDFVLVTVDCNDNCVVLISDLKSDKPKKSEASIQLLNSRLYVQYLFSMLECHYGKNISAVKYKLLIITTAGKIGKAPVYAPNNPQKQDSQPYKIKSILVNKAGEANIFYNELVN